jgi:hypothetical protein
MSERWHVTSKQGRHTVQTLTLKQAVNLEGKGYTVTAVPTASQKRALRQWAAQGIGAN